MRQNLSENGQNDSTYAITLSLFLKFETLILIIIS